MVESDHCGAPDAEVDALGLLCPLPILRAEAAARRLGGGRTLVLLADDPDVRRDVAAWCEGNGHGLLRIEEAPPRRPGGRPVLRCWVRLRR